MSKLLQLLTVLTLVPMLLAQDDEGYMLESQADAPAYHLGTYDSRLAARIGADGGIDTGFIQAKIVRGPGDRLETPYVDLPVSRLWGLIGGLENDVGVSLSVVGTPIRSGTDERLVVAAKFRLENIGSETRRVRFGLELNAGAGTGYDRPWGAVDFDGSATFTTEDRQILRDGRVVMTWDDSKPVLVEAAGEVNSPEAAAGVVLWELVLVPEAVRYVECKLVGPPRLAPDDESSFVNRLSRQPFGMLQESVGWESGDFGQILGFYPASDELRWMVLGGLMLIRSYGVANDEFEFLTDRPFGHEPTDAAVPVELLAPCWEWGFADKTLGLFNRLIDEARESCESLPPHRQLAYLHSLVRCTRLAGSAHQRVGEVVDLIEEFVTTPVEVGPEHDPEIVRADLLEAFADAGRIPPEDFPKFRWATAGQSDRATSHFRAHRRALAEGDSAEAWRQIEALYPFQSERGYGADELNGMPEGGHTQRILTVTRETLINDHGNDLSLFPGIDYGFIELRRRFPGVILPTRFGAIKAETYHGGRGLVGARVNWARTRQPGLFLVNCVEGATGTKMNFVEGGRARIYDEDTIEIMEYGRSPLGFRYTLHVERDRSLE